MAVTLTTGGAISGYCAIGNERVADRPAITMKMASTAAKIGRSMKKRENMLGPLVGLNRAYFDAAFGAAAGAGSLFTCPVAVPPPGAPPPAGALAPPAGACAICTGAPG